MKHSYGSQCLKKSFFLSFKVFPVDFIAKERNINNRMVDLNAKLLPRVSYQCGKVDEIPIDSEITSKSESLTELNLTDSRISYLRH